MGVSGTVQAFYLLAREFVIDSKTDMEKLNVIEKTRETVQQFIEVRVICLYVDLLVELFHGYLSVSGLSYRRLLSSGVLESSSLLLSYPTISLA